MKQTVKIQMVNVDNECFTDLVLGLAEYGFNIESSSCGAEAEIKAVRTFNYEGEEERQTIH